MARSQNAFNKKEKEKKRLQKKKEKQQRKEERKVESENRGSNLEDMMAYLDEDGNLVDTPPDETKKKKEVKASSIELGVPKREEEDTTSERRGRVNFFDHNKGYGFINQDGTQERFFVHSTGLKKQIQEGDKVSFQVRKGLKGMEAYQVDIVK